MDGNPRPKRTPRGSRSIVGPCFPAYTSNHGSLSGGGAEVLRRVYGAGGHSITMTNPAQPGLVFVYSTIQDRSRPISPTRASTAESISASIRSRERVSGAKSATAVVQGEPAQGESIRNSERAAATTKVTRRDCAPGLRYVDQDEIGLGSRTRSKTMCLPSGEMSKSFVVAGARKRVSWRVAAVARSSSQKSWPGDRPLQIDEPLPSGRKRYPAPSAGHARIGGRVTARAVGAHRQQRRSVCSNGPEYTISVPSGDTPGSERRTGDEALPAAPPSIGNP